jgi:hypothetical protein
MAPTRLANMVAAHLEKIARGCCMHPHFDACKARLNYFPEPNRIFFATDCDRDSEQRGRC